MTTRDLYDRDFLEWTVRNAALLRARRFEEADIEHIAEEIEDMGKSQRLTLGSRLEVLLAHLLKWRFQPGGRGSSWESTIRIQRRKSLSCAAVGETVLPRNVFPETCPVSTDQVLLEEFFPD